MADQFVLARIVDMRGVDLATFDFDYDLTWAAFFLNADEKIYGRYGGRDEGPADKGLSLAGLKYAMQSALTAYRRNPHAWAERVDKDVRQVERFAAARRVKAGNCIHCHQVYDFRRQRLKTAGNWTRDQIWVYPQPENVGLALDRDQGDRIVRVTAGSPAARVGLRAGDVLRSVGGMSIASYGDLQYALHRAPNQGRLPVSWQRNGATIDAALALGAGWRETDISWRGSMWGLEPQARVYGKDLTAVEKRKLSLATDRLAFRQGKFVPPESRRAGIRGGDIIIGVDGRELKMSMLQFNVYVRLNYNVGDRISFDVIRGDRRLEIPMTLTPDRRN